MTEYWREENGKWLVVLMSVPCMVSFDEHFVLLVFLSPSLLLFLFRALFLFDTRMLLQ